MSYFALLVPAALCIAGAALFYALRVGIATSSAR
jgi:hypothetical protein